MRGRKPNLIKEVFGRLTVKRFVGSDTNHNSIWECSCSCGNTKEVLGLNLKNGGVTSCGCWLREHMSLVQTKHGHKHGHAKRVGASPTYRSWHNMKGRCGYPCVPTYPRYGGLGVTVYERWQSFDNFLADMGERPEGTSLGRILDLGNYEPGNCFWMTKAEQTLANQNRRRLLKWAQRVA